MLVNKKLIKEFTKSQFISLFFMLLLSSCAGQPANPSAAKSCDKGLSIAYKELDAAKSKGFGGTVALVKASSLLSAASIQQEFSKFPNCINKVKRARYYIKQAGKGKSG